MRALLLAVPFAVLAVGCGASPPAYEPGVRVELARVDGAFHAPVFRWDAPVAARVTVRRGTTVVWEVAEGDASGLRGSLRRGPLTPPLTYGVSFAGATAPAPRTLVAPQALLPRRLYDVTVIGYDGAVFQGRFSVQAPVEPPPNR